MESGSKGTRRYFAHFGASVQVGGVIGGSGLAGFGTWRVDQTAEVVEAAWAAC